jgi:hypothetical protein
MRKSFFDKYAHDVHLKVAGLGATFIDMVEQPERIFTDAGYTMVDLASIPLRSVTGKKLGIPPFMVRWVMRTLRDGYQIGAFATKAS